MDKINSRKASQTGSPTKWLHCMLVYIVIIKIGYYLSINPLSYSPPPYPNHVLIGRARDRQFIKQLIKIRDELLEDLRLPTMDKKVFY